MKILLNFLLLTFSFSLLFGQVSYNQEFQVNTYTQYWQNNPSVCSLSDSGFVICWDSFGQDSSLGIFGQIFENNGSKRGSEFQINTYLKNDQWNPKVASLYGGGFVVGWSSFGQDDSELGVYGQIYNDDGTKRGSEFQVNTHTKNRQVLSSISGLREGGFVICWSSLSQDGSGNGIYGQIFNEDGTRRGSEFRVNKYTEYDQTNPSVSSLSESGFVVCWASEFQDGSWYGVYGQIYEEDGSKRGSEFRVNTYTNDNQWEPCVSGLGEGGFVVCWASMDFGGPHFGVYGQMYNEDGSNRGSEFRASSYMENEQRWPIVSNLSTNGFIVFWESYEQDGYGFGVYGQIFYQDGSMRGPEFRINSYTEMHQANITMSNLIGGGFVVSWVSDFQDESWSGIFAKYYSKEIIHPLVPYELIKPEYDETIKTLELLLNWQQASTISINLPYEIEYTLYLDEDDNFSRPRIIPAIYDTTCVVDSLVPGTTYFWKVLAKNIAGDSLWSSETNAFFVSHDAVSAVEKENREIPESFELFQNFPNPFNPQTTIKYVLPSANEVKVKIYNALGQLVEVLLDAKQAPGLYTLKWNAEKMPSGVYFCVVQAGQFKTVQKMLLVK